MPEGPLAQSRRVGRLALLAGMSWESSVEYERVINEIVQSRLGVRFR